MCDSYARFLKWVDLFLLKHYDWETQKSAATSKNCIAFFLTAFARSFVYPWNIISSTQPGGPDRCCTALHWTLDHPILTGMVRRQIISLYFFSNVMLLLIFLFSLLFVVFLFCFVMVRLKVSFVFKILNIFYILRCVCEHICIYCCQ